MLSLEMLGYFSDAPNSQRSPFPSDLQLPGGMKIELPTVGDFIAIVGIAKHRGFIERLGREMRGGADGLRTFDTAFVPMPLPDMLRSDHRAFLLNGTPAVMVTDSANFRNPNYHKATDTAETIDAERFTKVVRGVARAMWQMAGREEEKGAGKDEKWKE